MHSDIHKGHRQRLRDRAQREGLDAFDDHQVLELLLFYAIPRQDVSEIAHLLIRQFGSVKNVLSASIDELMRVKGVGRRVAEWLCSVGELVESYCDLLKTDRMRVRNYRQALDLCERMLMDAPCPGTYQICLSPTGVVQILGRISESLAWAEPDTIRGCLEDVLSVHARSVLIVECVEEEVPCVSDYELQGAQRYARTLDAMGAELIDVILVGQMELYSMAMNGKYDARQFGGVRSVLSRSYLKEEIDEDLYEEEM